MKEITVSRVAQWAGLLLLGFVNHLLLKSKSRIRISPISAISEFRRVLKCHRFSSSVLHICSANLSESFYTTQGINIMEKVLDLFKRKNQPSIH